MPQPSLFAHMIDQQSAEAERIAEALFSTARLDRSAVARSFDQGFSAMGSAFGHAFADAIASVAAQALAQGASLKTVGHLVGEGLTSLDMATFAYGINSLTFQIGLRHNEPAVKGFYNEGQHTSHSPSLKTEAKQVLVQAINEHVFSDHGTQVLIRELTQANSREAFAQEIGLRTVSEPKEFNFASVLFDAEPVVVNLPSKEKIGQRSAKQEPSQTEMEQARKEMRALKEAMAKIPTFKAKKILV